MTTEHKPHKRPRSGIDCILVGLLAIAAFFLIAEHKAKQGIGSGRPPA